VFTLDSQSGDSFSLGEIGGYVSEDDGYEFTQHESGAETASLHETGNNNIGGFESTLTGSGSYAATNLGSATIAASFEQVESGNFLTRQISRTDTGVNRYTYLAAFDNPANAGGALGDEDFSPTGTPLTLGSAPGAPTGGGPAALHDVADPSAPGITCCAAAIDWI